MTLIDGSASIPKISVELYSIKSLHVLLISVELLGLCGAYKK